MKIVADRDIPFLRGILEPYADVVYLPGAAISARDAADADALIVRTRTRCDRTLLEGSRVRFIGTATIGFDHIDRTYCDAHGIAVETAAGCNARGVLQWVAAVLAFAARREGWSPEEKTLGVVGVGHVGSLVAGYARRWGFRVLCCDPPRQREASSGDTGYAPGDPLSPAGFVPAERIAEEADIVTFHVPLTRTGADTTFHMADSGFLARMKSGALLLNSSRGEVVDGEALREALIRDEGLPAKERLRCAIDTWEHEPAIDRALLRRALLATPHIAGYSRQGKANAASMIVRALARRYGFPLSDWYPSAEVTPCAARPIGWEELLGTIGDRFDIGAQSRALKSAPQEFEAMRDHYRYREEYF